MNLAFSEPSGLYLRLPLWSGFLAVLVGIGLAAGPLGYASGGRINLLWLWLLWAGLPLLGALASFWFIVFGRARPWLFRWRAKGIRWYPNASQRSRMLWLLQCFWLLMGAGMLLGFWLTLLMTDLAFGWSSTILDNEQALLVLLQWLALPWQSLWPEAVPDAALMEATRYARIDTTAGQLERAGDWWRFLMASLICYNIGPRLILGALTYGRWRLLQHRFPQVVGPDSTNERNWTPSELSEASLSEWQSEPSLAWELPQSEGHIFGQGAWEDDQRTLDQFLETTPRRLLWRVNASRSPLAELADLVQQAREGGVVEQAIWAVPGTAPPRERHLTSWRSFCRGHHLVWIRS